MLFLTPHQLLTSRVGNAFSPRSNFLHLLYSISSALLHPYKAYTTTARTSPHALSIPPRYYLSGARPEAGNSVIAYSVAFKLAPQSLSGGRRKRWRYHLANGRDIGVCYRFYVEGRHSQTKNNETTNSLRPLVSIKPRTHTHTHAYTHPSSRTYTHKHTRTLAYTSAHIHTMQFETEEYSWSGYLRKACRNPIAYP